MQGKAPIKKKKFLIFLATYTYFFALLKTFSSAQSQTEMCRVTLARITVDLKIIIYRKASGLSDKPHTIVDPKIDDLKGTVS